MPGCLEASELGAGWLAWLAWPAGDGLGDCSWHLTRSTLQEVGGYPRSATMQTNINNMLISLRGGSHEYVMHLVCVYAYLFLLAYVRVYVLGNAYRCANIRVCVCYCQRM